jgi:predicted PurR-regulated permease PerM
MAEKRIDLVRATLGIGFIAALTGASFWIMRPFLGAIIWATMIAVSTWPFMKKLEKWLWGKRWLAVTVMTLGLLAVIVLPVALTVLAVADNVDEVKAFVMRLPTSEIPPAPDWVAKIPVVGAKAVEKWNASVALGMPALLDKMQPYLASVAKWLASETGNFGAFLVQFGLTVAIAAVMFAGGETAAKGLRAFARRLGGPEGEATIPLAGGAIRGVAMGVVVTSVVQALFAGVGLWIAGVPFTAVLTVLMFVLCIAQLGPLPVMAFVVLWSYNVQGSGWGTFLLVWAIVAGSINNVLQPILIKKGADLPLLLIFAGVIGGLLTFGIIGLFVGPVVLAVAYTLLLSWVRAGDTA